MNSKVRLEVPRSTAFSLARQEFLQMQQTETARQNEIARQLRVNCQKMAIEKAFSRRNPLAPFVDVTIDEFKVLFEEEIENELTNQGYYVIYTADLEYPNETKARIYPQMTPEDRETIHNHVHLLETEIEELLNDMLGSQKPDASTYKLLEMVTEIMKAEGYDAEISVECDNDSETESLCDCVLECPNCGTPVEDTYESDDDDTASEDESECECDCNCENSRLPDLCEDCGAPVDDSEDESDDECNCEDCGLPINPDLCEDCGLTQTFSP